MTTNEDFILVKKHPKSQGIQIHSNRINAYKSKAIISTKMFVGTVSGQQAVKLSLTTDSQILSDTEIVTFDTKPGRHLNPRFDFLLFRE